MLYKYFQGYFIQNSFEFDIYFCIGTRLSLSDKTDKIMIRFVLSLICYLVEGVLDWSHMSLSRQTFLFSILFSNVFITYTELLTCAMIADNILLTGSLITGIFLLGIGADFYANSGEDVAISLFYVGLAFIGISALLFITRCGQTDRTSYEEKKPLIRL